MQTGRSEQGSSGTQNGSRQTVDLLESLLAGDTTPTTKKSRKPSTELSTELPASGNRDVTNPSSRLAAVAQDTVAQRRTVTQSTRANERANDVSDLPSSHSARPFDEPRSRQDRRAKQQPFLIPDSGCRRKRDRRVNRSLMRNRPWWMLRSYSDKEIR